MMSWSISPTGNGDIGAPFRPGIFKMSMMRCLGANSVKEDVFVKVSAGKC